MMKFINLHAHTVFSIFDGLGYPQEHLKAAHNKGMNALAISDHGNMNGFAHQYFAQQSFKKEGINFKNIYAVEAYYTPSIGEWKKEQDKLKEEKKSKKDKEQKGSLFLEDDDKIKKKTKYQRNHLLLLAKNQIGLSNLFKLISESNKLENFYRHPRIDFDMLKKNKEGIITTTACLGSYFSHLYFRYKEYGEDEIIEKLRNEISRFLNEFGDNFYGELQWNALPEQHIVNQFIIQLSYEMGFKLISTVDSHYPTKEMWKDRELYKRLGWLGKVDSEKPEWINELPESTEKLQYELYLKNGDEVYESYKRYSEKCKAQYDEQIIIDSIERTHDIAFDIIDEIEIDKKVKLPSFVLTKDKSPEKQLTELCLEELKKKQLEKNKVYVERLKRELHVVKDKGFCEYFLTMKMIADKAKEYMLVGPGRGSAGGSLISYLLDIIQIDPIKWNLQFERFLTSDSDGMPDIDFDVARNDDLREYLRNQWGDNTVVQVSNFNTLQIKSLLKDISKFYNIEFQEINNITTKMDFEAIPKAKEKHNINSGVYTPTYEEYKEYSQTLQEFLTKHPFIDKHISVLKGQIRSIGAHAGGCLVADNLNEKMPLININKKTQTPWAEGQTNRHLEPLGFIKFDLLGLSTLRVFEGCIANILKTQNFNNVDIKNFYNTHMHPDIINFNDPNVWDIFKKGKFINVFQFTNNGAQEFCKKMQPNSIEELSAITSIYRPAALGAEVDKKYLEIKNGEKEIKQIHPIIDEVLEKTKGFCLYQEQVAELAHKIGNNISLDEGNKLRKLLTKKGLGKEKEAEKENILNKIRIGAQEKGITSNQIEEVINNMILFSFYGFNASHACSYSILSYQCAWLLSYYQDEWICAYLDNVNDSEKEKAISTIKNEGYTIKEIDINTSGIKWEVNKEKKELLSPLINIKGLGEIAIKEIIDNRPFNSINELLFNENIKYSKLNKRSLKHLFEAGALNDMIAKDERFKNSKHFYLACIENRPLTNKKLGQNIGEYQNEKDFTPEERVEFILNTTGIYPIELIVDEKMLSKLKEKNIGGINSLESDGVCWGIVKQILVKKTKKGKLYYEIVVIDDLFKENRVRCWGINIKKDKLYINHIYLIKLHNDEMYGFSTNGIINNCFKMLG